MFYFEAYVYHLSLYFIVKFQLPDHFLQKICNGKLGSHFMINKNRSLLILIVHFSLITYTYWTSLLHKNGIKHFNILKASQKLTQKSKFWESKTGLFKGEKKNPTHLFKVFLYSRAQTWKAYSCMSHFRWNYTSQ